jgi:hypothetical protein
MPAELIIGALALRHGLTDLVKASLTGSIIGNVLLVFGLCALAGGVRHPVQPFNRTAAGLGSTMLLLSAIGLTVPAVFHFLAQASGSAVELTLDTEYRRGAARDVRGQSGVHAEDASESLRVRQSRARDRAHLARGRHAVRRHHRRGVDERTLVGSVAETARALGMSELFVGVVIVAIVGNAAEHYTAVVMAARCSSSAISSPLRRWTCCSRYSNWWQWGSPCSPSRSSPMMARRTRWKAYNCSPSTSSSRWASTSCLCVCSLDNDLRVARRCEGSHRQTPVDSHRHAKA